MTKEETLAMHVSQLAETKKKMDTFKETWQTLDAEWTAKNTAFNAWISTELKVTDVKEDIHLAEILTKWTETKTGSGLITL